MAGAVTVGAMERRNPLPLGVYWQDFFTPPPGRAASIQEFLAWTRSNEDKVSILDAATVPGSPSRLWALFEVRAPVQWPPRFGIPTIAERGRETQEADTKHNTPTTTAEAVEEILEAATSSSMWRGLVILGLLYLFTRSNK